MGIAWFFAIDPYRPKATRDEIDAMLFRMSGVTDWRFHAQGEVAVAYRSTLISDQMIEAALEGVGYALMHISDNPQVAVGEVDRALSQVC